MQRKNLEDSRTLDQYLNLNKKQALALKKSQKQRQNAHPRRKNSTQLSLFSWLCPSNTNQQSLIVGLDKGLILKIYSYLRLTQLLTASRVCSYFLNCYRSLWNDKKYFQQLQTDKLTTLQLQILIQKSSKLQHIKQLKLLYSGKSIKNLRQKIKIKAGEGNQHTGTMLEIFSITPKNMRGSTFIMDSHLAQIVNSSFRCLKIIELVKCSHIREFACISRCVQLTRLVITSNDNFRNEDLSLICKRCLALQSLHFQQCRRLDQNIFEYIQYVQYLQVFKLKYFRQSFQKLKKLQNNSYLTHLDLQGSLINDDQAKFLINLKGLSHLSLKNCGLLTQVFLDYLSFHLNETSLMQVSLDGIMYDEAKAESLQAALAKN